MTLLRLALADLWHDRIVALCNIAAVVGVVAPLAILAGIKVGVVEALIADLKSRPDVLRIAIVGDHGFSSDDVTEVRGWPETKFVAPSSRSIARRLLVRRDGGGTIRRAALVATGPGEPLLPEGPLLDGDDVAPSDGLARRLDLSPGDTLQAVARRGESGDTVLHLSLSVAAVLPPGSMQGEAVLMAPVLMEEIEAFYDGYALPERGVPEGRPLPERIALAESMRIYATGLASVAALERRLEEHFGIEAISDGALVAATLDLERRLGLALNLIATAATLGLLTALTASFWGMTRARRPALAALAMIGMPPSRLAWYPVWVALVTAAIGLAATGIVAVSGAAAAERLFGGRLPAGASFLLPPGAAAEGAVLVLAVAAAAAFLAAREAARTNPGTVFREL